MNHQDDGEELSGGRSSVAAARSTLEGRTEAVRVAVQTQKADGELSLRVANAEARISALEQKVSERESTPAAEEAAEEDVDADVEKLAKQEAAANEIESHKNAHSAALQEIEETATAAQQDTGLSKAIHGIQMELNVQRFPMSDMRRQFLEHSVQLSSLRRDLHEILRWALVEKIQSCIDQLRTPAAAGSGRKMP